MCRVLWFGGGDGVDILHLYSIHMRTYEPAVEHQARNINSVLTASCATSILFRKWLFKRAIYALARSHREVI